MPQTGMDSAVTLPAALAFEVLILRRICLIQLTAGLASATVLPFVYSWVSYNTIVSHYILVYCSFGGQGNVQVSMCGMRRWSYGTARSESCEVLSMRPYRIVIP